MTLQQCATGRCGLPAKPARVPVPVPSLTAGRPGHFFQQGVQGEPREGQPGERVTLECSCGALLAAAWFPGRTGVDERMAVNDAGRGRALAHVETFAPAPSEEGGNGS